MFKDIIEKLGDNKSQNGIQRLFEMFKNGNQSNNLTLNDLRNIYIQRRISQKINSWNVVNLANIPLLTNNSIGEGMSLKSINLKLDPMLISEQICIKLYLYLSKHRNVTVIVLKLFARIICYLDIVH